ncbi:MAG: Gfo/Idh/MocA family oxidoreductase, partial [Planctomycetota bacterium]
MHKSLRIAVFGLGTRIAGVLGNLIPHAPRAQIVGWVDPQPAGRDYLTKRGIAIGEGFATPAQCLAATKPDIVFVGSPNHLHLEHITAALEAGVRVFSEKPVVIDLEQTWALARLLRKHGPERLLVGLVLRCSPLFRTVQQLINDGAIGRIVSLEANEHLHAAHGGFLMRDWRRHRQYSGSYLLEKCCHDFDVFQALIGAPGVRAASFGDRAIFTPENAVLQADPAAYASFRKWHSGWEGTTDPFTSESDCVDHQVALVQYSNGAKLSFHSNTHAGAHQRRWLICGVTGSIESDLATGKVRLLPAHGPARDITIDDGGNVSHYGADEQMAKDLAATLVNGAPFPVPVVASLRAGLTCMAIDAALQSGSVV